MPCDPAAHSNGACDAGTGFFYTKGMLDLRSGTSLELLELVLLPIHIVCRQGACAHFASLSPIIRWSCLGTPISSLNLANPYCCIPLAPSHAAGCVSDLRRWCWQPSSPALELVPIGRVRQCGSSCQSASSSLSLSDAFLGPEPWPCSLSRAPQQAVLHL